MKKSAFLIVLGLALVFASGCTVSFSMYPIEGPLYESGQVTRMEGTFEWDGSGHGTITVTMPDGELCTGEYTTIGTGMVGGFFTTHQYFTYFGNVSFTQRMQCGQAMMTGNRGTVIQAEYYVDGMTNHGFGLAKDNRGNVFKFMW